MTTYTGTPLISIVIPVYNIEAYIEECIVSVQKQTYKNLQIIVVDDGSTDNSAEICDNFAVRDKRIKVMHTENGGVSAARNLGLKIATGVYICFIDGDDYVAPNYVACLLKTVQDPGADIGVCSLKRTTGKRLLKSEVVTPGVFSPGESLRRMLTSEDVTEIAIWNKIYRLALFTNNNVSFPNNRIYSEDVEVIYNLYLHSSKVAYVSKALYFYTQRDSSVTGREFTRSEFDSIEVADTVLRNIRRDSPGLLKAAYKFRLRFTFSLLDKICQSNEVDYGALIILSCWTRKNIVHIILNQYVSYDKKIRALVLALGRRPYLSTSRLINRSGALLKTEVQGPK